MALAIAKTYYSQLEAEVAKSSLLAAKIPVVIFHKHINSMAPFLSVAVGGMSLMVPERDLEDAQALLALANDNQSDLETESEAFRYNILRGIVGLLLSYMFAWMPLWSRARAYKVVVKD